MRAMGDGDCDKGRRQAIVTVTKRAMAMGTGVTGNKRGHWQRWQEQWQWCRGWWASNSNEGNGDKGGGQVTMTRATATTIVTMWAMCNVNGDKAGRQQRG